jgi:hypothetical protein
MSKEATNKLKENDNNFFRLKLRKLLPCTGLYPFLGIKSEVNFAADRINLDDHLKTSRKKIMSSISVLGLSYLEKYEADSMFFDAQFFETFISCFETIIPDRI